MSKQVEKTKTVPQFHRPQLSGAMARLTNRDDRTLEGTHDGQDIILPPGEDAILPLEIAHHLQEQFTQGESAFDLETEEVEATYHVKGEPEILRDEETGAEGRTLPELLAAVKERIKAGFQKGAQQEQRGTAPETGQAVSTETMKPPARPAAR